jgi:hypothetical protein
MTAGAAGLAVLREGLTPVRIETRSGSMRRHESPAPRSGVAPIKQSGYRLSSDVAPYGCRHSRNALPFIDVCDVEAPRRHPFRASSQLRRCGMRRPACSISDRSLQTQPQHMRRAPSSLRRRAADPGSRSPTGPARLRTAAAGGAVRWRRDQSSKHFDCSRAAIAGRRSPRARPAVGTRGAGGSVWRCEWSRQVLECRYDTMIESYCRDAIASNGGVVVYEPHEPPNTNARNCGRA